MSRIYLDNNATTEPLEEVRVAVAAALALPGNPSSPHASGRAARAALSEAREAVAALLDAAPSEIVFTSGGTEADNLAVLGGARAAVAAGAPRRVVISAVEHPAVHAAAERLRGDGWDLVSVPVDSRGLFDADDVARACAGGAALVALILVQNETGAIQPVERSLAAARAAAPLARLHVDAVQALGKVAIAPGAWGADTLAVSAHKIHGPKGIGALWIRRGAEPVARAAGGSQERGIRTGTENVPGAAGFGAAAAAALRDEAGRAASVARVGGLLADRLLALPGARLNGPPAPLRHPGTLNVSFDGVRGDLLLMALDQEGVDVSTGAACASGAPVPSRSLAAMGLDPVRCREAVRVSAGALTKEHEVAVAAERFRDVLARLRAPRAAPG